MRNILKAGLAGTLLSCTPEVPEVPKDTSSIEDRELNEAVRTVLDAERGLIESLGTEGEWFDGNRGPFPISIKCAVRHSETAALRQAYSTNSDLEAVDYRLKGKEFVRFEDESASKKTEAGAIACVKTTFFTRND